MIDLNKPLELSDGTPVKLHATNDYGDAIVEVPEGHPLDIAMPGPTYRTFTGPCLKHIGGSGYSLRNRAEVSCGGLVRHRTECTDCHPTAHGSPLADTLKTRGETYGSFDDNSQIAQSLKGLLRNSPKWAYASSRQKEAAHQICSKLSRLFSGDVNHKDSWLDIAGYATLAAGEEPK